MSSDTPMQVKPSVDLLEDLLGDLQSRRVRVPRFQRPFVWRPAQMTELFDSIESGFPIGSILLWETPEKLASLESIGELEVKTSSLEDSRGAYLLDGHQRLSTLYGTLMRKGAERNPALWQWWVYRNLRAKPGEPKYVHIRKAQSAPEHYLPVSAALRTMEFLAFARRLADSGQHDVDELVTLAEDVSQKVKSYRLPVISLVGGSLDGAVEVFSRLNSRGATMAPEEMVSALTFRVEDKESLGDRIRLIQEAIEARGFGRVSATTIFRVVLVAAGNSAISSTTWSQFASVLGDSITEAARKAEEGLFDAISLLTELGCSDVRLLPYDLQLILLSAFFALGGSGRRSDLVKWFWATSTSGFFRGANTTEVRQYVESVKLFARGHDDLAGLGEFASSFPERFDSRSARVRAFILFDRLTFSHRLGIDGTPVASPSTSGGSSDLGYRHIVTSGSGAVSSPANRIALSTPAGVSAKRALLSLAGDPSRSDILASHGIPENAYRALTVGDDARFISLRCAYLAERERDFLRSVGVEVGTEPSDEDVDMRE